mgnify:CR=1 FL=1
MALSELHLTLSALQLIIYTLMCLACAALVTRLILNNELKTGRANGEMLDIFWNREIRDAADLLDELRSREALMRKTKNERN